MSTIITKLMPYDISYLEAVKSSSLNLFLLFKITEIFRMNRVGVGKGRGKHIYKIIFYKIILFS